MLQDLDTLLNGTLNGAGSGDLKLSTRGVDTYCRHTDSEISWDIYICDIRHIMNHDVSVFQLMISFLQWVQSKPQCNATVSPGEAGHHFRPHGAGRLEVGRVLWGWGQRYQPNWAYGGYHGDVVGDIWWNWIVIGYYGIGERKPTAWDIWWDTVSYCIQLDLIFPSCEWNDYGQLYNELKVWNNVQCQPAMPFRTTLIPGWEAVTSSLWRLDHLAGQTRRMMPCESERILLELRSWVGHNWLVILVSVFLVDFRTPKYGMIGIMILRSMFLGPGGSTTNGQSFFRGRCRICLGEGIWSNCPKERNSIMFSWYWWHLEWNANDAVKLDAHPAVFQRRPARMLPWCHRRIHRSFP